jgi:hypothetical protein
VPIFASAASSDGFVKQHVPQQQQQQQKSQVAAHNAPYERIIPFGIISMKSNMIIPQAVA